MSSRFPRRVSFVVFSPWACLLAVLLPLFAAAAPGTERWRWRVADYKPTAAAFSPQGEIYVVLNHQIIHADGALFALRVDGSLGWTNWFRWPVPGEPVIGTDGRIHLLISEWQLATVSGAGAVERIAPGFASHPAVDTDGDLVAVHWTNGLQVLSPAGEVRHSFPFGGALNHFNHFAPFPAPRLFGDSFWLTAAGHLLMDRTGRVFWSTGSHQTPVALLPDGSGVFADGDLKHVGADGSLRWQAGRTGVSAPPVVGPDGTIFTATTAGEVLAYRPDGTLLWQRDAGAPVLQPPAVVTNGTVLVLNDAGRLTAFAADGTPRWHFEGGAAPAMRPCVGPDGSVLMGFNDGTVVLVEGDGAPGGWWPQASHDAANTSRAPGSLTPPGIATGLSASGPEVPGMVELRWSPAPRARAYEVWRGLGADPDLATVIATHAEGNLLFRDANSELGVTNHYWLRAVNEDGAGPFAGPVAGVQKVRRWSRRFGHTHSAPQILPDGGLVVNAFNAFDATPPDQGVLVVLEEDGVERWRRPLPWGSATRSSIATDGRILAMGGVVEDPPLMCFSPLGEPLWSTPISGQQQIAALAVDEAGTSYVLTRSSSLELVAVDRDGHLAWRTFCGSGGLSDFLQHPTVLADGRILVGSGNELRCFLPGGGLSWRRQLNGAGLNPVPDAEGRIYFRTSQAPLALNPDGSSLWTNATTLGGLQSPETLVGDGVIWFPRGRDRLGISPTGEVLHIVSNVQASGTVPALDVVGRFVGIVGRELVRADAAGNREVLAVRPGNMEGEVVLSPSGRAYVLSVTGAELHAYDVPAGLATNAPWPIFRGDPRGSASRGGRATPPAVPEGFLAEAFVGQALLRWTASTQQLASATVWRGKTADPAAAVPVLIGAYGGYVFDTNAAPGRNYHYWLQAANSAGTSTLSGPLSVTIPEARAAWTHRAASRIRSSVSASADGPIYYQRDGYLTSLNAVGEVLWEKFYLDTPGDIQATPPAVGRDGTIHVATLLKLFAFHPDSTLRWTFEAPPGWLSTDVEPPTVGPEGDVYHAAGEWIMAVTPDGRLRWRIGAGSALRQPPVLSPDGVLYVSVFDRSVQALRTTDGALLWQHPWPSTVPPGGLLLDDDGTPLIGAGAGWYRFSPAGWQVFGDPTNSLSSRALRPPDGGFIGWAGTTPNRGELVVLGQDGAPLGRNSLGTLPLVLGADGTIFGSGVRSITPHLAAAIPPRPGATLHQDSGPTLHEGVTLRTIRAHRPDGALAWEHALPADVQSATLTHDGLLLVTTLNDVVALRLPAGAPRAGWPVERGNPGQTGTLPGEPLRFSSHSLDGDHLTLLVRGPVGQEISLEHTADFTRWVAITNATLTNGATVLSVPLTTSPGGFFRAR